MITTVAARICGLQPLLRRLSRKFTRDADQSADLVQDTVLKALAHQDKFRENTNLQGWLFTIMRNTFINQYRRQQRGQTVHDLTKELYFLNIEDQHTFSSPERKYAWDDLWKNIDALREELKLPFKLHTSGYKYHEIAETLQIPIGTVKNRIFHARKEIQSKLHL